MWLVMKYLQLFIYVWRHLEDPWTKMKNCLKRLLLQYVKIFLLSLKSDLPSIHRANHTSTISNLYHDCSFGSQVDAIFFSSIAIVISRVLKVLKKDIAIAVARYLKEDEAFLPPPRYECYTSVASSVALTLAYPGRVSLMIGRGECFSSYTV